MLAVYSVNPSGPLTLLARVAQLDPGEFRRLDAERRALRLPAMRDSVFLAPAETAPRLFAATRRGPAARESYLRSVGVGAGDYARLREALPPLCGEPRTLGELCEATGMKAGALRPVVGALAREGLLLRVPDGDSLRASRLRYRRADPPLPRQGGPEALAWLAGEYLRAFGPARVEDFAWWTASDAGAAAALLAEHDTVDAGDGLLARREDEPELDAVRPARGAVALLPKWDCWTMGYAPDGRARFLPQELRQVAYEPSGDGLPVIVVGGRVAGGWSMRFRATTAQVELRPAERPGAKLAAALRERAEEAAAFLGASKAVIAQAPL